MLGSYERDMMKWPHSALVSVDLDHLVQLNDDFEILRYFVTVTFILGRFVVVLIYRAKGYERSR